MSAPPAACERTQPGLLVSSLNSPLTAFDHPCLTAMAHPKMAKIAADPACLATCAAGTIAFVDPARQARGAIMVNYLPGEKWPLREEAVGALAKDIAKFRR